MCVIVFKKIIAELQIAKNNVYPEDIARKLKLKGDALSVFWSAIKSLESQGLIKTNSKGIIKLNKKVTKTAFYTGKLDLTSKGYGFVTLEPSENNNYTSDIFISSEHIGGAMHADKVSVRILTSEPHKKPVGEIVAIVEAATVNIVGNLMLKGKIAFVTPDNKKIKEDIYIPFKNLNNAKDGQKVSVQITKRPIGGKKFEGRILEILGNTNDNNIEIISIIKQQGLQINFPDNVLKDAKLVSQNISKKDLKNRTDLRNRVIVTIDGEDARDLDDAVYIEKNKQGFLLGVYIADVSNYVPINSAIDLEARERATSVYLVDRVLPMLPIELSNGICSLNAKADRLVMACEMNFNLQGALLKYQIFPAVISVDTRLSYPIVKQLLTGEGNIRDLTPYNKLLPMLKNMLKLRNILNKKRQERGAIDFNFPEPKVKLDENNKPIAILKRENGIAESIIEEFMLAANETVAAHLSKLPSPSIYRVHEPPSAEKIESLQKLLLNFNINAPIKKQVVSMDIQKILEQTKNRPEEKLISFVTLRSLQQARYLTENLGHFGLAAECYTHFTSPIRRYPDLMIHRLLYESLGKNSKTSSSKALKEQSTIASICEHSSIMERKAAEAERASVEYKMAEYMYEHIGEFFNGIISSVTGFGIFVELDNGTEGLVHITTLADDYYVYDENSFTLYGERTGRKYRLGDSLKVEVLNVNITERTIDLIPADTSLENKLLIKANKFHQPLHLNKPPSAKSSLKNSKNKTSSKTLSPQAKLIKAAAKQVNKSIPKK